MLYIVVGDRWYYPDITRPECETILKEEGKEGAFIVRESSSKGMYTLSIFTKEV